MINQEQALEKIAQLFEKNSGAPCGQLADLFYDARCIARTALQSTEQPEAADRIDELERQNAELRKNADRYTALRNGGAIVAPACKPIGRIAVGLLHYSPSDSEMRELDAYIDGFIAQAERPNCPRCDGTGDVCRIDGEWVGFCDCEAGAALRLSPSLRERAVADANELNAEPPKAKQDGRKRFESKYLVNDARRIGDRYENPLIQAAWEGWQAAKRDAQMQANKESGDA